MKARRRARSLRALHRIRRVAHDALAGEAPPSCSHLVCSLSEVRDLARRAVR